MIDRILAGAVTAEDIEAARAYSPDDRKKLLEQIIGKLGEKAAETVLLDDAMEDVANGLRQARPVFAAGLSADQALGFIIKLVQESLGQLEESGEADSDEYEKQEIVLDKLNKILAACNETGNTQGEEAQETAHLEYRGECGQLESLRNECEAGIANSIEFIRETYGKGNELTALGKGIDHSRPCVRFIGKFGSPSFFAFKRIAKPGESQKALLEAEDD